MADQESKNELITQAKNLGAPAGGFSLQPRTFDEAYRFANLMAESDLLPKEFHGKPANVLLAVQLGMELGVSPMQALQNLYVVNGRPAIFGDLLPAIVFNSGLLESIHEEGDEKTATCTVKRKNHEPITRTFTWADAERAKLPARNPTYNAFPKRMLQMRARSWAIRDMFPDVLKGCAIKEELDDAIETTSTPVREQISAPQPLRKEPENGKDRSASGSTVTPEVGEGGDSRREDTGQIPKAGSETTPTANSETNPPEEKKPKAKKETKAEELKAEAAEDNPNIAEWIFNLKPDEKELLNSCTEEEAKLFHWIKTCPESELNANINKFTNEFNTIKPYEKQIGFLRVYNKRRQGKA